MDSEQDKRFNDIERQIESIEHKLDNLSEGITSVLMVVVCGLTVYWSGFSRVTSICIGVASGFIYLMFFRNYKRKSGRK